MDGCLRWLLAGFSCTCMNAAEFVCIEERNKAFFLCCVAYKRVHYRQARALLCARAAGLVPNDGRATGPARCAAGRGDGFKLRAWILQARGDGFTHVAKQSPHASSSESVEQLHAAGTAAAAASGGSRCTHSSVSSSGTAAAAATAPGALPCCHSAWSALHNGNAFAAPLPAGVRRRGFVCEGPGCTLCSLGTWR